MVLVDNASAVLRWGNLAPHLLVEVIVVSVLSCSTRDLVVENLLLVEGSFVGVPWWEAWRCILAAQDSAGSVVLLNISVLLHGHLLLLLVGYPTLAVLAHGNVLLVWVALLSV